MTEVKNFIGSQNKKIAGKIAVIGLLIALQLEGFQTAPVPNPESTEANAADKPFVMPSVITVVFHSTCQGQPIHKVQIGKGQQPDSCFNVKVASPENEIKTDPSGIALELFEKEYCAGESTRYDPSSSEHSSLSKQLKVQSFQIVSK